MLTDTALHTMISVIAQTVSPERVLLFGSHARGDATENSDVDLMVILPTLGGSGQSRREITGKLYRELARFKVPKDILIYSHDEVEQWKDSPNHVVAIGLREGRVLYEQSEKGNLTL
jgi:predicted nucleotidyltransferase